MKKKARVTVMLKRAVLDPQGQAVKEALLKLGFNQISDVRIGKAIDITVDENNPLSENDLKKMADAILANPVMEEFSVELAP